MRVQALNTILTVGQVCSDVNNSEPSLIEKVLPNFFEPALVKHKRMSCCVHGSGISDRYVVTREPGFRAEYLVAEKLATQAVKNTKPLHFYDLLYQVGARNAVNEEDLVKTAVLVCGPLNLEMPAGLDMKCQLKVQGYYLRKHRTDLIVIRNLNEYVVNRDNFEAAGKMLVRLEKFTPMVHAEIDFKDTALLGSFLKIAGTHAVRELNRPTYDVKSLPMVARAFHYHCMTTFIR